MAHRIQRPDASHHLGPDLTPLPDGFTAPRLMAARGFSSTLATRSRKAWVQVVVESRQRRHVRHRGENYAGEIVVKVTGTGARPAVGPRVANCHLVFGEVEVLGPRSIDNPESFRDAAVFQMDRREIFRRRYRLRTKSNSLPRPCAGPAKCRKTCRRRYKVGEWAVRDSLGCNRASSTSRRHAFTKSTPEGAARTKLRAQSPRSCGEFFAVWPQSPQLCFNICCGGRAPTATTNHEMFFATRTCARPGPPAGFTAQSDIEKTSLFPRRRGEITAPPLWRR